MTANPTPAEGELDLMLDELEMNAWNVINAHATGDDLSLRDVRANPYRVSEFVAAVRSRLKQDEEENQRLSRLADRDHATLLHLVRAIRDAPEFPDVPVLNALSHIGKWPSDWEQGKQLQRSLGLDKIPPRTEYELGAGVWFRLRARLKQADAARQENERLKAEAIEDAITIGRLSGGAELQLLMAGNNELLARAEKAEAALASVHQDGMDAGLETAAGLVNLRWERSFLGDDDRTEYPARLMLAELTTAIRALKSPQSEARITPAAQSGDSDALRNALAHMLDLYGDDWPTPEHAVACDVARKLTAPAQDPANG